MAAPFHLIEEKCEDAVKEWLEDNDIGSGKTTDVQLLRGFDTTEQNDQMVGIFADESIPGEHEAGIITGNWKVHITLIVKSHFKNGRAAHRAIVAAVRDVVFHDNAVSALNASGVTDFHVMDWFPGVCRRSVEDHSFITEQEAEVYCEPQTVA